MFAGIRADTPVLHVELGAGSRYRHDEKAPRISSLFTVTSHELAQQVLTDNVRFSSAANAMTIGPVMGRTILQMDAPEHQRHRALVAKAFRTRVLDQWSDAIIGATVSELIEGFAGDGHADLIPQLTFPFPVRVIARILGLPEADWPRFLRLSTQLIAVMRNWEGALAASRELRGYFAEIIADRRRHTRQPERFLWIDESGVVSRLGSRAAQAARDRKHHLWIPPSAGWVALDPRAQQLVADVLLLLNLAVRGEGPDEIERRLRRLEVNDLPLCFTRNRNPLDPKTTVGSLSRAPGTNCIDGCRHRLCPYPPYGVQPDRSELSEAFCRGQQTLLNRGLSAPWQTIPRVGLKRFWAQMADRPRGMSTDYDLD